MNTAILLRRLSLIFVLSCATVIVAHAQPAATPDEASASSAASDTDDFAESPPAKRAHLGSHHHRDRDGNDIVSIGHDSHLGAGEKADSVVSVMGSSSSEGEAVDVVSVLGNTRVTGTVHDDAVAVLGNLYIDGRVEGDAVAVLGSVQLGPHAEIMGDLTSVLGSVHRAPEAIVHGDVHDVMLGEFGDMDRLHAWIHRCLLEGRPLAFVSGVGWAWSIAFVFLALYFFLALLFPSGIRQCVETLETHPGNSALAALLTVLLSPVLLVLLSITVIGIAAVPFVVAALFCLSLFGKAVVLAWMGRRVVGPRMAGPWLAGPRMVGPGVSGPRSDGQQAAGDRVGRAAHPAAAVLIGGAIALLLYAIPGLGFLAYKLLGFFGVGAVVYTLLLGQRSRQAARAERVSVQNASAAPGNAAATPESAAAAPRNAAAEVDDGAAAAVAGVAGTGGSALGGPSQGGPPQGGPSQGGSRQGGVPPQAVQSELPPQILASLPRAGFWLRMGALVIDVVLIGFLTQSGSHVLGLPHHEPNLHLLLLATYGACMWKLRGSTVGGIALDLRVVRVDGRPVEWETAIVRALGCFLSLAVCGLGFIWIAFDQNHQAWHDKIAGTVVVRVPKVRPVAA